jgi:hypothetical protein
MRTNFDHEKLEAYQKAISFVTWADALLEVIPKHLAVHNQLERAAPSILHLMPIKKGLQYSCRSVYLTNAGCRVGHVAAEISLGNKQIDRGVMMSVGKTVHLVVLALLWVVSAQAEPFNAQLLDGRPTEYTAADLRGAFVGESTWGDVGTITNLYVTWDDTYLYVALQGWQFQNKLVVMLDVDPGEGTGATATWNWAGLQPAHIGFNAVGWEAADATGLEFGLDYLIATEGFYNDIVRVDYDGVDTADEENTTLIFSAGNGATPQGSEIDMVVLADDTDCLLKGLEARIPWAELYPEDGRYGDVSGANVVPTNARIRVFANVHNNDFSISASSPDTIPAQVGEYFDAVESRITTTEYIEINIDSDGDGMPDNPSLGQNPPFLRDVLGKAGGEVVYARFSAAVTTETVTNTANWLINGLAPDHITNTTPDTVFLYLAEPLPTNGVVEVWADGVRDVAYDLTRETALCLIPSADGLDAPLTVRFVLETDSGMGQSRIGPQFNATAFFLNGDSPLEWGYPPSMATPVDQVLAGSVMYCDVIFPPGTPLTFNYKFSALLPNGTNNYEAIRLANYLDASRVLTLNTNVAAMYVTNYLGAAGAPLRGADVEDAYSQLYDTDWLIGRGDAGVRERKTVTFQLDLSAESYTNVTRVLIQGTDPLRGFNIDDRDISDWAGQTAIGWDKGGITLYDDGTHGDLVADDGIFSRTWSFTEDGTDPLIVSGSPNSLVGGDNSTLPYIGSDWFEDRSPRSFKYQYYVVDNWGATLNSPGYDIEAYIEPGTGPDILLDPFVWDGPEVGVLQDRFSDLVPAPTNSPTVPAVAFTNGNLMLSYDNNPDQVLHVVDVTDDLLGGFHHYGQYLPLVNTGEAEIDLGDDALLFARVRADRGVPYRGARWSPNPVPDTGATVRIYFNQQDTVFAGDRNMHIAGSFEGWSGSPMTFAGDGTWFYDVEVAEGDGLQEFKFRDGSLSVWYSAWGLPGDQNYPLYQGDSFATWTPMEPLPGEPLTITYDAEGGPLDVATNIFAHLGFDEGWDQTSSVPLTNVATTVWETTITVPTNYNTSVNFVFNDGGDTWHSEDSGGRMWRAFIGPVGPQE